MEEEEEEKGSRSELAALRFRALAEVHLIPRVAVCHPAAIKTPPRLAINSNLAAIVSKESDRQLGYFK